MIVILQLTVLWNFINNRLKKDPGMSRDLCFVCFLFCLLSVPYHRIESKYMLQAVRCRTHGNGLCYGDRSEEYFSVTDDRRIGECDLTCSYRCISDIELNAFSEKHFNRVLLGNV